MLGLVRDVLGSDVVGAYLHGSAVLGGLRDLSDLDILVVTRQPTTEAVRRAMVDGLLDISGSRARRGPARPVELSVVVQSAVRPWRYPPMSEFLYGEWLRDAYEAGTIPGPEPSPTLATLLTMVLDGNATIMGPPPRDVLDPVPPHDLRASIVAGIPELLDEIEDDTRNVVLTLARIWRTLATGEVTRKDAAADWTLGRLPVEQRPVLQQARDIYLGELAEEWSDLMSQVPSFVDHVIAEIDREWAKGPEGTGPVRTR